MMNVYLLSNNLKYIQYWKSIVVKSKSISIDEVNSINSNDILIVDNTLYTPSLSTSAQLIVLDNEPNFDRCLSLLKENIKAYGNIYMHSSHILSAIESLREKKVWIYPDFVAKMISVSSVNTQNDLEEKLLVLTPREKEISKFILEGLTNKEIAIQLEISPNTIKKHTKHIYEKFNVSDRLSLFSYLK